MTRHPETPPRLTPIWIVAFSGHRPSAAAGCSREGIAACRSALRACLVELHTQAAQAGGAIELLCGLADGSDLMAIGVADELGLPVHLILPMPEADFRRDFSGSSDSSWAAVAQYIAKAQDPRSTWTVRTAIGDNARPGCYHDANLQMLEAADVLVAIYNGEPASRVGGTAEIVRIANSPHLQRPTIIIDLADGGRIERRGTWVPDGRTERLLEEINGDLASRSARQSVGVEQRGGDEDIWAIHRTLDRTANFSGRRFRGCLGWSIWLNFSAAVLAACAAAFASTFTGDWALLPKLLATTELLCVTVGAATLVAAQQSNVNPRWRRARFGAEVADGLICSAGLVDPLDPLVERHDGDWRRFALSVALAAHREKLQRTAALTAESRFEDLKTAYLTNRIEFQRAQYFSRQSRVSVSRFRFLSCLATWASVAAVAVLLVALVRNLLNVDSRATCLGGSFLLLLAILLPVVASLATSLIITKDIGRRASRYAHIGRRLDWLAALIPMVKTTSAMRQIVAETEDMLLDELIEWRLAAESMDY